MQIRKWIHNTECYLFVSIRLSKHTGCIYTRSAFRQPVRLLKIFNIAVPYLAKYRYVLMSSHVEFFFLIIPKMFAGRHYQRRHCAKDAVTRPQALRLRGRRRPHQGLILLVNHQLFSDVITPPPHLHTLLSGGIQGLVL
jgi:hypothetical protein